MYQVNIGRGEQSEPSFLKLFSNDRIPAIVDRDPAESSIREIGAILLWEQRLRCEGIRVARALNRLQRERCPTGGTGEIT